MPEPINREYDLRWQVLGEYVRDIADRMGLNRWYFEISHDAPRNAKPGEGTPEADTAAECECMWHELVFYLSFGDGFFTETCLEKVRQWVVHELCHVIDAQRTATLDVLCREDCISDQLWNHWEKHYRHINERAIDWYASCIAPRFPLIEWEKTDSA